MTVWTELWPAVDLFTRYANQWRVGPGGVVALDYAVIQHELQRRNLSNDDYDELFAALRVIERAALDHLSKS